MVVAIKKSKHSAKYPQLGKNTTKFYKNIHRRLEFIATDVEVLTYNFVEIDSNVEAFFKSCQADLF